MRQGRPASAQGGHELAAGAGVGARVRRRPGRNPRGGGEAQHHRGPAHRPALQLACGQASARGRRIRRGGQLPAAQPQRADAGHDRPGHRQAPGAHLLQRADRVPPGLPRRQGKGPGRAQAHHRAHAALLLRLPAQQLHQAARRQPRPGWHRLPLHDPVDGPQHRHLHPDGRGGRDLDRPGALHRYAAHLPEPR
ncbi:hypothetical protein D9M68_650130 [compost metagenome]